MFDQAAAPTERNALTDWVLRGGIGVAFLLFGLEKFPSDPNGEWPRFFAQVGIGQWFRYLTGIVEVSGAALVLIPWTVNLGMAVLAVTMAGAAAIHVFVMHHPFNAIIPGAIGAIVAAVRFSRRPATARGTSTG
jgi:uncharacterized membrane protein YphA (DoxX/SURF4 family)